MKRQLVEDLKTRLKVLQEMEKSYRGQVEDLEKKVHAPPPSVETSTHMYSCVVLALLNRI